MPRELLANCMVPVLYSFRRCPYAIRARLALRVSGIQIALREVILSDKPVALLACSAKATVPVLVTDDQRVIDESVDIMIWALNQYDPQDWLVKDACLLAETQRLVAYNDNEFKLHLDHYKYADRFPDKPVEVYRAQGECFLKELEAKLATSSYLLCERPTFADMAILPFIRQFSHVDKNWFEQSPYPRLQYWLTTLLNQPLFISVMGKYEKWQEGDPVVVF